MESEYLEKRLREKHRKLALSYIKLKNFLPTLLKKTSFKSYRLVRMYQANTSRLSSIIVYLDKSCRVSVGEYFICGVRSDRKKTNAALSASKDLEEDFKNILLKLNFKIDN